MRGDFPEAIYFILDCFITLAMTVQKELSLRGYL